MSDRSSRADFGTLLARAWSLYSKSLHITFPAALLCGALPVLVVLFAAYYAFASGFEPVLRIAQAVLRSLLENGFDEWAMGAAVEQVLAGFGGLDPLQAILRALGGLGITVLVVLLALPVLALLRLMLVPVGRGASLQAQRCALAGEPVGFSGAFSAARRHLGRLIAVDLLLLPVGAVVIVLSALLCIAAGKVPGLGRAAVFVVIFAVPVFLGSLRQLSVLHLLEGNVRVFSAVGLAFRRFFTDWTYAASGALFCAGLYIGTAMILAVDVLLMVLAMLPPFAAVLFITLFLPLCRALTVVMLKEQIRRADPSADA